MAVGFILGATFAAPVFLMLGRFTGLDIAARDRAHIRPLRQWK